MREIAETKQKEKKMSGKSCQNDLYKKKSTVRRSIFYTAYLNVKYERL